MKNIKDITISIFAIIGFVAILSSFNNQAQQQNHGTPESNVWEVASIDGTGVMYNKKTGDVRILAIGRNAWIAVEEKK